MRVRGIHEGSAVWEKLLKELFTLKNLLLIIYSPPCHPRCPCLSFFSRKEIKVFDENIPTSLGTKRFKVQMRVSVQLQRALNDTPWTVWFPMKSIIWRKSWNVFIKNLNFFMTEERKTWTTWMTWGWVNYQQKFFFKKWTTPLSQMFKKRK